ncbi:MAG: hypothetical protein AAB794_03635 [Patescibacteria group bacterium]
MLQSARSVRAQLANIFCRHAELNRHHQHIVGRVVTAIVRLYVRNIPILQKPLDLSAVHGIASQAVNLPTHDTLRLALLYSRHHLAEHRTAGHLRGLLLDEYLNDVELFTLGKGAKLGELAVDRQNLFVFNISRFSGV